MWERHRKWVLGLGATVAWLWPACSMMLRMALPLDQMFFSDFLKKYLKQETDALMFQFLLSALIFHHRLEKSGANLLSNYDATCIFHICSLINVTYRNKWKLMTAWHKNTACKQCLPQPENTYPVNINRSNFKLKKKKMHTYIVCKWFLRYSRSAALLMQI